jgi:biopolymer transport protein ExbD
MASQDAEYGRVADEGSAMKQINVFPMVILLVVVVFLIAWLGGAFR